MSRYIDEGNINGIRMCVRSMYDKVNRESVRSFFDYYERNIEQTLVNYCANYDNDAANWLWDIFKDEIRYRGPNGRNLYATEHGINTAFFWFCDEGNLDIAKWFYSAVICRIDFNYCIFSCYQEGHLEMAKWIWEVSGQSIKIHEDNELAFRTACKNHHFDVMKWLWDISNQTIDIHANNEEVFREACHSYCTERIDWLCEISNNTFDIHVNNEEVFRNACNGRNIDIMKKLWEISNHTIDIHANNEEVFRNACKFNNLDMMNWLWDISNHTIDIHANNDEAFHTSFSEQCFCVVKLLIEFNKNGDDYFTSLINKEHVFLDKVREFINSRKTETNVPVASVETEKN